MTKDILLSIKGNRLDDTEEVPIEIVSHGEYYCKGDKHFILYDEVFDEKSGTVTKCMVKIADGAVEITRRGEISTRMLFDEGKYNIAKYSTPMGILNIGIMTKEIRLETEEDYFDIEIEYTIDLNNNPVSECCLKMRAESVLL